MTASNQYPILDSLSSSDQVYLYSSSNGFAGRASLNLLTEYLSGEVTASDDKITQYSVPSATGFTTTISNGSDSVWLILTPTAGFATGTIVLPASANCVDRQEILVNCTQVVTTLTVSGNGASVVGAPTSLSANSYFRLRFDRVSSNWYRVG